jgi:hypothetical protein
LSYRRNNLRLLIGTDQANDYGRGYGPDERRGAGGAWTGGASRSSGSFHVELTGEAIVRQALLDGKLHFLQKPFNSATVERKVRELLDSTPDA